MRKLTPLLALPALLLLAAPAAGDDYRSSHHARKNLQRLAHEVVDGAQLVYRSAAGQHGRYFSKGHRGRGHGRRHGFYGPRDSYTLRVLADLEVHARDFERALHRRPIVATHHEFAELNRAFDRAASALYRTRVSPTVERDFECLAEYLFSLNALYEEYAYPRRARYRSHDGRYDRRVEVWGPRWNVTWRQDAWRGYDRDWDSDSDSDSY